MADEVVAQTDDNSQSADAASSSADAQNTVANPPAGENSGGNQGSENRVPQSRFNEVIEQRNRDRARAEALEAENRALRQNVSPMGPQRDPIAEQEVRRLVSKLNMSEDAAREIVESQLNIAKAQRVDIERKNNQFRAEEWTRQKANTDPEYRALMPELESAFARTSPQMQAYIAQDPEALEMFYEAVKSRSQGNKAKESYTKGVNEAYQNKASKAAISSIPGAGSANAPTALTREAIKRMSSAEYMKRQSEINEAIKSGKLK